MLIGHTGTDVKMHYFENGRCLGRFTLATNESYINKTTGEQVVNTEWHNIVVRNKAAEICEKYLKKGDKVYIEGSIRTRKYQDQSGAERYFTEIMVQDFTFLTPKGSNPQPNPERTESVKTESKSNASKPEDADFDAEEEDDLPF